MSIIRCDRCERNVDTDFDMMYVVGKDTFENPPSHQPLVCLDCLTDQEHESLEKRGKL